MIPNYLERVKQHRRETGCSLFEAVRAVKRAYVVELAGRGKFEEAILLMLELVK